MPYAILRFAKRKAGGVTANYTHNERKKKSYKSNPDIDMERSKQNYHIVAPNQTYRKEANRIITAAGCKVRSNSTVMVETIITASPEFMNGLSPPEQMEYFNRACEFMESKIKIISYQQWCIWTRELPICTFLFAQLQRIRNCQLKTY